jgi:hypothetical protein
MLDLRIVNGRVVVPAQGEMRTDIGIRGGARIPTCRTSKD